MPSRLLQLNVLFQKIPSIQNAAVRLVTGTRRCDHITPMLRQLHWLPVRRRVDYKVACLVHQSLAGQTPAYLSDDVRLVTDTDRRPFDSTTHKNNGKKMSIKYTH